MRHVGRPRDGENPTRNPLPRQLARDYLPPLTSVPREVESAFAHFISSRSRCHKRIWDPWAQEVYVMAQEASRVYSELQERIANDWGWYNQVMFKLHPTHHAFYRSERLAPGRPPTTPAVDIGTAIDLYLRRQYDFRGIPLLSIIHTAITLVIPAAEYELNDFTEQRGTVLKRCQTLWDEIHRPAPHPIIRRLQVARVYQLQADYPFTAWIWVAGQG